MTSYPPIDSGLDGQQFLTTIEREQEMTQERQRAEQARQKAEQLANYLRSIGVDLDNLPTERSDSPNPNNLPSS